MADYGLVQIRYNRVRPSGQPAEDVMVNTVHLQVADGGWDTDSRDTFSGAFEDFWTVYKAYCTTGTHLEELRMYDMPAVAGPVGDPVFTVDEGVAGTAALSGQLPYQTAVSITWKTTIRRRWGRIYLPSPGENAIDSGRFGSGFVDALAAATHDFGATLRGAGMGLVVWHRSTWTPTDTVAFRIDDNPDVIRRRRLSQKYYFVDGSLLP